MVQEQFLVRYGTVPEVARCTADASLVARRGERVVVNTHRGLMIGELLERVRTPSESEFRIERLATPADLDAVRQQQVRAAERFDFWQARIAEWGLTLELVDLEWTLDGEKEILYVLTERGPDTTNLALQAAAAGLGLIEVQPVTAQGLVSLGSGGGGCGSGGCGCSHD